MKDNPEFKIQKKKQKYLLKELQSAQLDNGSNEDNWETIDMKKQLHPIGYYINDREEMIRQMFTVITGQRLKNMLPSVLKDKDLDELKADCLIHLVGMSSKRIRAILEGSELDISSDESETDTNDSEKTFDNKIKIGSASGSLTTSEAALVLQKKKNCYKLTATSINSGQTLEDGCSVISGDDMLEIAVSNSEMCDDFFELNDDSKLLKNKRKKLKCSHQPNVSAPAIIDSQLNDDFNSQKLIPTLKDKTFDIDPTNSVDLGNTDNQGKTLLEILELEMRARAIRALLKRDDSPNASPLSIAPQQKLDTDGSKSGIPQPDEVIDLTTVVDNFEASKQGNILSKLESGKIGNLSQSGISKIISSNQETCVDEKGDEGENLNIRNDCKKDNFIETSNIQEQIPPSTEKLCEEKQLEEETKSYSTCVNDKLNLLTDKDNIYQTVVNSMETNEDDNTVSSSWAQRWLDKKSKDVKRLVTTSKMCTTIRNKMKRSNVSRISISKCNKSQENNLKTMPSEFRGSIDEYNMLIRIKNNEQLADHQKPKETEQNSSDIKEEVILSTSSTDNTLLNVEIPSNEFSKEEKTKLELMDEDRNSKKPQS